jgi:hypothetical protein
LALCPYHQPFFSLSPPLTTALLRLGLEPLSSLVLRYTSTGLLLFVTLVLSNPKNLLVRPRILFLCMSCGLLYFVTVLSFTNWAATLDSLVNASAQQVGGERRVRFVTDANCNLSVQRVVVSAAAAADFATMVYEMREQMGFNNPSRKYLVWMDASTYCGIAQVYPDDSPGQDNGNNGRFAMFARVDRGCWDVTYSTALHELMHTLGGVQQSAPHGTSRYHCTDDDDRLCYSDGSGVTMTFPCAGNEAYLDCNHDDCFHPNPPAGSYLASHWNVANSSFLQAGTTIANQAPVVNAGLDQSVTLPSGANLTGSATDDGLPSATLTHQWSKVSGPGWSALALSVHSLQTSVFRRQAAMC